MKQLFRFFTLLAVAVVSSTAAWALDWGDLTLNFKSFQAGDTVFMYNVGTGKFYNRGADWGTRALVAKSGRSVVIQTMHDALAYDIEHKGSNVLEEDLPEGTYAIFMVDNHNTAGNEEHHSVRLEPGGNSTVYVDSWIGKTHATPASHLWEFDEVATNTYTIHTPKACTAESGLANEGGEYVVGKVLGVVTDNENLVLSWNIDYAGNEAICQWKFVAEDEGLIYFAKMNLRETAEEAEKCGLSTAKAKELYDSNTATAEEINSYNEELRKQVDEALRNLATYKNPTTLNIVNGNCGFSGKMDGWTVSNNVKYGNNCVEYWSVSGSPYIEQTLTNMPAGLYRLKAEAYTRTNMHSVLQFGEASMEIATVGSDKVNSLSQGNAWFNNGNGMNVLVLEKKEAGDITIRLTADNTTGDHWTVWRSFEAQYFGAAETDYRAYTLWETEGYEDLVVDKYYTKSYLDAVATIVNVNNEQAMTKDECLAVAEKAKAAMADLRKNIALLDELVTFLNDEPWDGSKYYDEDGSFAALWEEVNALFEGEITQTNAELEALANAYKEARQNALDMWMVMNMEPGTELTDRLINPHFIDANGNSSFTGWTIDSDGGFQNNAGTSGVVEQWNGNGTDGKSIDVWQEIRLMRVGAYRLETKGWYRCDNDQAAYQKWLGGDTDVLGFLYASYSKDKFHNIFDRLYTQEEWDEYCNSTNGNGNYSNFDGMFASNGVWAANDLFNNTHDWDMSVDFLSLGEPTKLGILAENLPAHSWIIWDDFKLTYIGDDLETMKEVAAKEAKGATDILDEGNPMSQEAAEAVRNCVDQINAAEDIDALLEAYKNINLAVDNARKSIANYKRVESALAELNDVMNDTYDTATKEAYDNAEALYDEMMAGIDGGTIKDSEIEDVIARIIAAKRALLIPSNFADATDDNHIDFTKVIENPRYFNDNTLTATLAGWTNVDGKTTVEAENDEIGVAEGYSTSFDFYQDINGLPEGTYLVKVDGLYRQGSAPNEAKMVQYNLAVTAGKLDLLNEDDKKNIDNYSPRGEFYANDDVKTLARWNFMEDENLWNAEAITEFEFADGDDYYEYVDSISNYDDPKHYYFPNMRRSFYQRTLADFYQNETYCYVGSDGHLRIGVRNTDAKESDWVPFTNWRLEYLGTESKYEGTTGVREIETEGTIEAVYSIDGRRQNSLQKGLNIIVVNGKAKKVMVK